MQRNKTVVLVLCIALGYLGIHRFYVGKKKSGILYLCTAGLCGIGWIVDIFLICTDRFTDNNGLSLQGSRSFVATATAPATPAKFDNNVLALYESEGRTHLKHNNFGLYRNTRLSIAQHFQSIQDFESAIAFYSEVLFWDLSGCDNNFKLDLFFEMVFPTLFPYENSALIIAPGVIREMEKCKAKLGLSDEQLKERIYKRVKDLFAPVHIFSPSEIADMYFWERDENKSQMKKVFAGAKSRFNPKKPKAAAKM